MRFAIHSSKVCIDSARMYQPGFAVYITLEGSTRNVRSVLSSDTSLCLWRRVVDVVMQTVRTAVLQTVTCAASFQPTLIAPGFEVSLDHFLANALAHKSSTLYSL
jgi:hypothetical protein